MKANFHLTEDAEEEGVKTLVGGREWRGCRVLKRGTDKCVKKKR